MVTMRCYLFRVMASGHIVVRKCPFLDWQSSKEAALIQRGIIDPGLLSGINVPCSFFVAKARPAKIKLAGALVPVGQGRLQFAECL
jgi:hypothetical protein